MIDLIFGPFQYSFMVRALVVSLLVGVMCPALGAYVITRGRAFMGDALAHSVLPAMVLAFMLGFSPFFAAVPAAVLLAVVMGGVARRTGISEDTSIGITFAGMFALGLGHAVSCDRHYRKHRGPAAGAGVGRVTN